MNKRFSKKSLFSVVALICIFCVSFAPSAFAASAGADRAIPGKPSGLVISTNWIADEVGQKILDDGGNAIDAAAAVGYALAVVHPTAGNLGGGGFAVIRYSGENYALDFREMAPAATHELFYVDTEHPDFVSGDTSTYRARNLIVNGVSYGAASLNGYSAAGVPGTVAGLNEMVRRFGTKTLEEIIEPSVRLAGNGFRLHAGTASGMNGQRANFMRYDGSRKYFIKDVNDAGAAFQEGELFVQNDLAQTLKRIALYGSNGFYRGLTADMIVADMPKYGGVITHDDLANYKPVWREPVVGTYSPTRNTSNVHTIVSMSPPSSGGTHIVQMLNTIENENVRSLGFNSLRTVWLMAESMRYAFADRSEYMGDPDFIPVPVDKLISKDYGREIYDKIIAYGELKARPCVEIGPGFGPLNEGADTTHYSVIDRWGNAVSITYTINSGYGCKAAIDGGGFLMNNEMDDFATVLGQTNQFGLLQGQANKVEPGKRPLSSMSPTIVLHPDGTVFLVTGSPGGSRIITAVLHSIVNAVDHQMSISQVVSAPRFHLQWPSDTLERENVAVGFTNDALTALRDMGYVIGTIPGTDISAITRTTGSAVTGAHDPRSYYPPNTISFDDLEDLWWR